MTTQTSVCAVIVTWNKSEYVLECLSQVFRSSLKPAEIVVVDNASEDDTVEKIKFHFPEVTILVQPSNLGGSGGFNAGINYALSKGYGFIWLLDNDAIPGVHFLRNAISLFKDEKIAIIGAQILNTQKPNKTVELGAYINWHVQSTKANLRDVLRVKPRQLFEVDYVPICCALVRSQAIETVGLLDSAYFLHWDDMDWGWRFKKAGYKVIAYSSALAWHKAYGVEEAPLSVQYYDHRNALYFYAKHTTGIHNIYLLIFGLGKKIFSLIKNSTIGKKARLKVVLDATSDFLNQNMGKNKKETY